MAPLHRLFPLLPMFAVSLAMSACASDGGGGASAAGGPFKLMPHDSATLAPGVVLTYDSVSDSRCPPDVKCIWAGRLDYRFSLKSGNTVENFALAPDKPWHASGMLPGARIELDLPGVPAPAQAQGAAAPHAVTIRLARP